jgi:DNA repair protein RadC
LLRTGGTGENAIRLAERLLGEVGDLGGLRRASAADLCTIKSIGPAKAAQLLAAIELGNRLAIGAPDQRPTISSPADAANLLMYRMAALEQEYLYVIQLDTRNRLIGPPAEVYHGSLNTSIIRVGEVFREAVKRNAAAVIVVHNHPSGDPSPSPEDVAVTRLFVDAGKLLDITVLDHLVIGNYRFVSLKERGLGFG